MDTQVFSQAQQAYEERDFHTVVSLLESNLAAGDVNGPAYHLLGNAAMRLKQFDKAITAYQHALQDPAFTKQGAVNANLGKACIATNRLTEAVDALKRAANDPGYASHYKAYQDLGSAYLKLNDIREAGIAFRTAALDPQNPAPVRSLLSLATCFRELGRPADAIESLRTTLDFAQQEPERRHVYAELGRAYVAVNRMEEALSSFESALARGNYELSEEAARDYNSAREVCAARRRAAAGSPDGTTDSFLALLDPLDPTGASGTLMPSPEESGFFDITEPEMKEISKKQVKAERKNKHVGLKIFIAFMILLLIAAGALAFAFWRGYGLPTQEQTIEKLFEDNSREDGVNSAAWAKSVSEEDRTHMLRELGSTSMIAIEGIDREMLSSQAYVTQRLAQSGEVHYLVSLERDGLGFKVREIRLNFASAEAGQ